MEKNILISGFGGQGMIKLGKILAEAALSGYRHISWFPSYGAEMRGGTAHCSVKVSDQPISSPFFSLSDIAVIFNQPSLDKFKNHFNQDAIVILNSDLIQAHSLGLKGNASFYSFPLNEIALRCGNIKVANSVALGAILALTDKFIRREDIILALKKNFPEKDKYRQNLKALREGEKLC